MNASMNAANASAPSSIENERRAHEPSMEEILASIRKIIADDDALPLSRPSAPPRLFEATVTPFSPPPPVPPVETAPEPETGSTNDGANARLDAAEMESFAEVGRELSRLDPPAAIEVATEQGDEELRPGLDAAEPLATHAEPQAVGAPVDGVHDDARSWNDIHASDEPPADEYVEDVHAPEPPEPLVARERADAPPAREAAGRAEPAAILSAEANASVASAFQALSASVQMASAEAIDRHVREMLRPMLKQWLDDNLPVMVERLVRAEIERVARGGR